MAIATEEKKKRALLKKKQALARKLAKQRAKIQSPEFKEKQREKQLASAKRQQARQLEKVNSPEYRAKQFEKAREAQQRQIDKAKAKPPAPVKPRKKVTSKGLLGRTPTALEKRITEAICQLPCIACLVHGRYNPVISYHHTDGRTKPLAHAKGLPLCAHHHDTPADKAIVEEFPDLIPIHAKGVLGGRAAWEKINGTQEDLLKLCYEKAEIEPPEGLFI